MGSKTEIDSRLLPPDLHENMRGFRAEPVIPDAPPSPDETKHRRTPSLPTIPKYKHALAIHSDPHVSVLTRGSNSPAGFEGFRNLMFLVILTSNLRLMLINFKKYGVLICLQCHDFRHQDLVLGAFCFFLVPAHLFIAYIIESLAARQARTAVGKAKKVESIQKGKEVVQIERLALRSTWERIAFAHAVNATLNLAITTFIVYYLIYHPGVGTLCELHAIIVWLKTCSYALTNRDLRHAVLSSSPSTKLPKLYSTCPYPRNITFGNLCYFWWAPTLVYQPVYPRTEKIRWWFAIKRAAEVVALSILIWIASAQYAVPLLQNSLAGISELDIMSIGERLMKLSSISLFCWLAGFYAIFQSAFNFLAEILRFGDREFYSDWWNSPNLAIYWSSWNKPVYNFMKRHVYLPLVARGCPKLVAQFIVFTFSAIMHEVLVGIPTHNIIGIAFAGMMAQIPLVMLTDQLVKIKFMGGKTIGNMIFWVSFVLVGQPLAVMLYFFAWHAKYGAISPPHLHGAKVSGG